jgi:hypothetical protein
MIVRQSKVGEQALNAAPSASVQAKMRNAARILSENEPAGSRETPGLAPARPRPEEPLPVNLDDSFRAIK